MIIYSRYILFAFSLCISDAKHLLVFFWVIDNICHLFLETLFHRTFRRTLHTPNPLWIRQTTLPLACHEQPPWPYARTQCPHLQPLLIQCKISYPLFCPSEFFISFIPNQWCFYSIVMCCNTERIVVETTKGYDEKETKWRIQFIQISRHMIPG